MRFEQPPRTGDEKETLVGFLNSQRAILHWKADGLSLADAARPMVPSGTSILGVIRHMACVELYWFGDIAAAGAYEVPGEMAGWWQRIVELWESGEDPDADFRVEDGETVEQILGYYETAIGVANEIIDAHDLDHVGGRDMNLRWILVHMTEETARHAGHADIIRELIDGTTGYLPD